MARRRPKELAHEEFVIREVEPRDLEPLFALAKHLDSVNLPHDRKVLRSAIAGARASFRGTIRDPFRRSYLFVMESVHSHEIIGASMIFAQHGTSDAPHVFFDVVVDQRYSVTLDRHFRHTTLRLGFDYSGPSEIGSLVLDPRFRSLGLGKPLSYVRFLFMGMYRDRFRSRVIAELMPNLLPDGRSELWESVGRHFTGLDYQVADKLSRSNKEFIISLFPQTPLHVSLMPRHVAEQIGVVGDGAKGVERMLRAIGFEYSNRIDPFDGGPHFEMDTDRIGLVRNVKRYVVSASALDGSPSKTRDAEAGGNALVGVGAARGPTRFRALSIRARFEGDRIELPVDAQKRLGVRAGSTVWATSV